MATEKRKSGKAKPVTSHQLFPAVVALWFGALFGLGSLAIRPSLIEGAVIKSGIDLIIPAAAPPLGVTARILIALILAALGAVIGAAIARRIARPKQEVRRRKRGANTLDADFAAPLVNGRVIDAPLRQPISAHEELGEHGFDRATPQVSLGGRRRALAIAADDGDFVPHDMAPLPGGQLQILDVGGDEFGAAAAQMRAEPLDLASFAETGAAEAEYAPVADPARALTTAPLVDQVRLDWSQAQPIVPDSAALDAVTSPSRIAMPALDTANARQLFQPLAIEPGDAAPELHEAAAEAGRQVFGLTPPAPPPSDARQIFGMSADADGVASDIVKAAGYQMSVFDTPEPSPLFPRFQAEPAHEPAPEAIAAEPALPSFALAMPEAVAAPLPSPADLGMTDLAARLAESMQRRRAARSQPQVPATIEPETAPEASAESFAVPVEPAPEPQTFAPAPQAFEPAPQDHAPIFAEPAAAEPDAAPAPYAVPSEAEPVVAVAPAPQIARFDPFADLPPIVIPASAVPTVSPVPAAPLAMPAALRALQFDDLHDEDDPLDSLLPPRRIGIPAPQSAPAAFAAPEPETETETEPAPLSTDETGDTEENYGSLLELGRLTAANPFVRIEEPAPHGQAVEPVVIFPGQAGRPATIATQFAAPAAASAAFAVPDGEDGGEVASFRRFDAPAQAGQGQPVSAASAGPVLDPEETDRALRSALANLQRMSGAA